jgi:hypothetical protein
MRGNWRGKWELAWELAWEVRKHSKKQANMLQTQRNLEMLLNTEIKPGRLICLADGAHQRDSAEGSSSQEGA